MSNTSTILLLTDSNWPSWRRTINRLALGFGDAGKYITDGQKVSYRMPDEDDCYLLSDISRQAMSYVTYEAAVTRDADIFGASQNPPVGPADADYQAEVTRLEGFYGWIYLHNAQHRVRDQSLTILNMDIKDCRRNRTTLLEKSQSLLP